MRIGGATRGSEVPSRDRRMDRRRTAAGRGRPTDRPAAGTQSAGALAALDGVFAAGLRTVGQVGNLSCRRVGRRTGLDRLANGPARCNARQSRIRGGTSMPLLGALVFLMVVAQTFISVGQTFLSTKRKGKSEADRNVCPTGHRGYAIFAVLLGIFGAAAIVLPAVCLPIALGGLLGVLFGLVWQWTGHSASAQAGPQTAAKPSSPGSTSTIAARLGLVLFVASLLLFGCRAAKGAEPRRDCGRGGPRCRRRRRAALFRISRVHTDRRPAEANRRKGLPARGVRSSAISPRGTCRKAAGLANRRSDLSRRVGPRRRCRPVGDRHVASRV